jgi:lipopolysaccharide O-acetyltransferase
MSTLRRRFQQAWTWIRWRPRFAELGAGSIFGRCLKLGGGRHVCIGSRVRLGPLWRLEAIDQFQAEMYKPVIRIGDQVSAEVGFHVAAAELVEIGDDVLVASWVYISDHGHRMDADRPVRHAGLQTPRPVRIGDGCWLGERCVILPGVELGPGCVVGAGAVVTHGFGPGSVVAGVPARLLRVREGFA